MTGIASLVNGTETDALSVYDRGLHYGDGVFETIAIRQGHLRHWDRHMQRLRDGARRLGFDPLPDIALIAAEAERLAEPHERAVLKIIVTRGVADRGYAPPVPTRPNRVLVVSPWPTHNPDYRSGGVTVRVCTTRLGRNSQLAGIKHLNRLEQVMARGEWGAEFAEGLMLDDRDRIIEGTMSNLFCVHGAVLVTPALLDCGVAGVMREVVMELAQAQGHTVREQEITRDTLATADEVFLTNSLIGIWPVKQIDDQSYDIGKITRALQTAVSD